MSSRNHKHDVEFFNLNDIRNNESKISFSSKEYLRSNTRRKSTALPEHNSFSMSNMCPKTSNEDIPNMIHNNKEKNNIIIDNDEKVNLHYWYRGELMELSNNYANELQSNSEVVIEQKIELVEILSGCESQKRFYVYLLNKQKQKKFLFKCKEHSSCVCRNCIPSNSRSFDMEIIHVKDSNKRNTNYKHTIASFKRPFECTCCCLNRPILNVYKHEHKKGEVVGRVIDLCTCGVRMDVYGERNLMKWKIIGEYCQCGLCCRNISIGKCYEVDFWIYDANANIATAKPVGNIHKVFKGLSELITDSDAFILTFPVNASPYERLLLIGSVIMINYRYYESITLCDCGNII